MDGPLKLPFPTAIVGRISKRWSILIAFLSSFPSWQPRRPRLPRLPQRCSKRVFLERSLLFLAFTRRSLPSLSIHLVCLGNWLSAKGESTDHRSLRVDPFSSLLSFNAQTHRHSLSVAFLISLILRAQTTPEGPSSQYSQQHSAAHPVLPRHLRFNRFC